MKPRGIPIAQIDSNTELDSKFQKLSRRLSPQDYYAALGTYMSIALRAWGTASRELDSDLLDMMLPDSIGLLKAVGLLDEEAQIPEAVFDRYIGEVLRGRAAEAERKRNVRRTPPDIRRTPPESAESSSPLLYSPLDTTVENGTASPTRVREEDIGAEEWLRIAPVVAELTGRLYHNRFSGLAKMLVEDAVAFGSAPVIEAMRAVAEAMDGKADLRALAFGVRNALRPPPDGKAVAERLRDGEDADAFERRVAATRRRIESMKGGSE